MNIETTFVLVKPDGVKKNLINQVKQILQKNGFKIIHEKAVIADHETARNHLDWGPEWKLTLGERVLKLCMRKNIDVEKTFMAGMTAEEIGQIFEDFIVEYNVMGPMHAMIVQGEDAINKVNLICGDTVPEDAAPNTIRGQLCHDTFEACIAEKRAPYNVVHSADSPREAKHQIDVWFPEFNQ